MSDVFSRISGTIEVLILAVVAIVIAMFAVRFGGYAIAIYHGILGLVSFCVGLLLKMTGAR